MQLVRSYTKPLSTAAQPIYNKLKQDVEVTQKHARRRFRGTGMTIREFAIFDDAIRTPRGIGGKRRQRSALRAPIEDIDTEALHEAITRLQSEGHTVGEPRVAIYGAVECFMYHITVWP